MLQTFMLTGDEHQEILNVLHEVYANEVWKRIVLISPIYMWSQLHGVHLIKV